MAKPDIITFVFSDIEHSTRLAQSLREAYPALLEKHRTVIRKAINQYEGREIDTAGDGFFMTFKNAQYAVLAVTEIQQSFQSESWAKEVDLKVRIGVHTGEALATKTGYTGVEVHCASRICSAAHGGQVLISQSTFNALVEQGTDLSFTHLGDFLFKDFNYPTVLFQLNIPGMNHTFPKPRIELDKKRIAVLPFSIQSKDTEHEYVGEGIAEELIVALGKVKGLRVVSRSTAFAVKNEHLEVKEIGEKLKVDSVLEGRLKLVNGQMRISVELIDTNSGLNIWSDQYNSTEDNLIQMQDEITQNITDALECELVPEELGSIQHRQTHNAEAYDFYLRGRRFYLQFSKRGIELALHMFEKAIEADHQYALAYAGLTDCYCYQYSYISRTDDIILKAKKASKKAIELAPDLADAHVSRGNVWALLKEYDQAEQSFQFAIEHDPTLFYGWFHYGRTCFAIGKLDKAARLFEQANEVEPDDYQSILLSAQSYDDIGAHDLAQTLRRRGADIAEKWLDLNPGDTRALYMAANAYVFLNQRNKSLSLLKRALALEPDDSMLLYNAGCIYALLEMKEEALYCLEKAFHEGLTMQGWYDNDSNLDSLRDEPRFQKLIERIRTMV